MIARGMVVAASLVLVAATQPGPSDTIEVIGRKQEEIRREAQAFVRAVRVAEQPVARWIDPICPKALEVAPEIAAKVEARIRRIAQDVGARLAPKRCAANLKIVFTRDAQTLLRQVANKSGDSFETLSGDGRALMFGGTAPVRWWHTVASRTHDGDRPASVSGDLPGAMLANNAQIQLGGSVHQLYKSSMLSSQMARGIIAAKVVIDVEQANGIPLEAVTALTALVGLAEIQMGEAPPPASILSLFEANGPRDLTALDENFLRTLYKLPLDRTAVAHRGMLVRGITRQADR